jgi:DNA-binding transcriptional regulator YiaG
MAKDWRPEDVVAAQRALRLSNAEMAQLLGVRPSTLEHYRGGRRAFPGPAGRLVSLLLSLPEKRRAEAVTWLLSRASERTPVCTLYTLKC